MRKFRDINIRLKLTIAIVFISGLALIIACATFIAYEYFTFTKSMVRNLSNLAGVMESNLVMALDSDTPALADETLKGLAFDQNILAAAITLADGTDYSLYVRSEEGSDIANRTKPFSPETEKLLNKNKPHLYEKSRHLFHGKYLYLIWNIQKNGKFLGTLSIQSSLEEVDDRIGSCFLIILAVFLGCLGMIFMLSTRLRKLIVKPILDLAHISKKISREKNYSVRAEKQNNDEVGMLTEAFNEMLDKIQRREMALENSNNELQAFAYAASHDLQEPLRKIIAFGDRLKAKCADTMDEQGLDYLNRMQNAAARMQDLIQALLNYSRVTTKANLYSEVDLANVVQEVLGDLEMLIEEVDGKVEVGELPTIKADPIQMRQLMQNIIGNALKYHREDVPARVRISGKIPNEIQQSGWSSIYDDQCLISIDDNGIGFEDKYRERIFGIFQRLHGRNEYDGTGVGLAICRKIVERHGGNITAESQPGQGASFKIRLPLSTTEKGN